MKILSSFVAALLAASLAAQDAKLSVLHGVPGLPAPVQVFANGGLLFSFDYGEQRGPLALPAGAYALEVRLNGAPILSANANVQAGLDYSVIAHLDAGGAPRLSVFGNSLQALQLPSSRLYVRHCAQAPAVDVLLGQNGATVATIPNLANGAEAVADVPPGRYDVRLNVAGQPTTAFGPVDVVVENGNGYAIFATGNVANPSFRLQTQLVPLSAKVTVVHGIPGLPAPVTVRANGANLFNFDFREVRGPLVVNPGNYTFDVVLNGTPVLSRNDVLRRGDDVTAVAHLDTNGGNVLSAFVNDVSPVPAGQARVIVRHLANAPTVDVRVQNQGATLATIPSLSNGQQAVANLPLGNFGVSILGAGTTQVVFGPAGFRPVEHLIYQFFALGSLGGNSFGVEVVQRDLAPAVPGQITTRVGGWGCGPVVGAQPTNFDYGQPFELRVSGAPANAMALVNFGDSITAAGPLALPLALQPFGAPGCFLNTNALATLGAMTDGSGALAIGYTVPRALFGLLQPAYFQVGVLSTAANTLGVVTSQYLEIR